MKLNQKPLGAVMLTMLAGSIGILSIFMASSQSKALAPKTTNAQIAQIDNSQQNSSASDAQLEKLINQGVLEKVDTTPSAAELKAPTKTKGQGAVKRALTQQGYRESGNNCNKFSQYFNKGCQYWCADFVSWSFDFNHDRNLPWNNVSAVSSIQEWGKRTHHTVKSPQRGDIFILKGAGISHTGIVRHVQGSTFTTIEGNSDDKVQSLKRPIKTSYTSFVRVP
jgi:hypothetical protein